MIAIASSSPVINRLIDPLNFGLTFLNWLKAAIKQAIDPFISLAPRPINLLFFTVPENGFTDQDFKSPTGTTSVCPAKQKLGDDVPSFAYKFLIFLKFII